MAAAFVPRQLRSRLLAVSSIVLAALSVLAGTACSASFSRLLLLSRASLLSRKLIPLALVAAIGTLCWLLQRWTRRSQPRHAEHCSLEMAYHLAQLRGTNDEHATAVSKTVSSDSEALSSMMSLGASSLPGGPSMGTLSLVADPLFQPLLTTSSSVCDTVALDAADYGSNGSGSAPKPTNPSVSAATASRGSCDETAKEASIIDSLDRISAILASGSAHACYTPRGGRLRIYIKIDGVEPSILSSGVVGRLHGAAAAHGYAVMTAAARAGCLELICELLVVNDRVWSTALRCAPSGVPKDLAVQLLRSLGIDWGAVKTKVHLVVGADPVGMVYDAREQQWQASHAPPINASPPPTLHSLSPLCVVRPTGPTACMELVVCGSRLDSSTKFLAVCQGRFLDVQCKLQRPAAANGSPSPAATSFAALPGVHLCLNGPLTGNGSTSSMAGGSALTTVVLQLHGIDASCSYVRVEAVREGIPSGGGHGVLVVQDSSVAAELADLEAELAAAHMAGDEGCIEATWRFLEDFGSWLEYMSLVSDDFAAAAAAGLLSAPALDMGIELRCLFQQKDHEALMRTVAVRLLAHVTRRGWRHAAELIMHGLITLGCTLPNVAAELAADMGGLSLLHHAILSRSVDMVDAVVSWGVVARTDSDAGRLASLAAAPAVQHSLEVTSVRTFMDALMKWAAPPSSPHHVGLWDAGTEAHGLTPLHLAAGLNDGGALARHILKHHAGARAAWSAVCDSSGTTPLGIARLAGNGNLLRAVQWHLWIHKAFSMAVWLAARCTAGHPVLRACLFGFDKATVECRYMQYATWRMRWCDALTMVLVNMFGLAILLRVSTSSRLVEAMPHVLWLLGYTITGSIMWFAPETYARQRERLALLCAACRWTCTLWISSAMHLYSVLPPLVGQRAAFETILQYNSSASGYRAALGGVVLPGLCEGVRIPLALLIYVADVGVAAVYLCQLDKYPPATSQWLAVLTNMFTETGAALAVKCIRDYQLRKAFLQQHTMQRQLLKGGFKAQ